MFWIRKCMWRKTSSALQRTHCAKCFPKPGRCLFVFNCTILSLSCYILQWVLPLHIHTIVHHSDLLCVIVCCILSYGLNKASLQPFVARNVGKSDFEACQGSKSPDILAPYWFDCFQFKMSCVGPPTLWECTTPNSWTNPLTVCTIIVNVGT